MKLTQLSTSEFKLESTSNLCLNTKGNSMILTGNSFDLIILELMYNCSPLLVIPYSNKQIAVPQDKPINKLLKDIDLVRIYERSNALESQELALNTIYVAECSIDPVKARVLQADFIPSANGNLVCLLTTYGFCEIYQKSIITGEWHIAQSNISKILCDIFSHKELSSCIKTVTDLKNFINKYIITSFSSSVTFNDTILYLGTAAGYVIALKYIKSCANFEKYCTLKTNLERITYISISQNIMLLVSDQGKVLLVKVNDKTKCLEEIGYLWNKADRIACNKAIINYCTDLNSYLIVFCKSAHVLVFRIDVNGAIVTKSILYINGIKITGLESLSKNEFIITTISGSVKYIKVVCTSKEELKIEHVDIEHNFDSSNYQILSVAASSSKNLWSFLLFRNKEYVHQSKFSLNSVFLNVCKLSTQDSFQRLTDLNFKHMNTAQDLIMGCTLDIFNNLDLDKYLKFVPIEELSFPKRFNDAFLQKLQMKLIFLRKYAEYQKIKYRKIKRQTENDINFVETSIQCLYILSRLQYLKKIQSGGHKFSPFQELSIVCMQSQFTLLTIKLAKIKNHDEENGIQKTVANFLILITDEYELIKFNVDDFEYKKEYCEICNEAINNFEVCDKEHNIKRCIISFTQISLYQTLYCPYCYSLARNDEDAKLNELFSSDENIKCTFCRFLLNQEEI